MTLTLGERIKEIVETEEFSHEEKCVRIWAEAFAFVRDIAEDTFKHWYHVPQTLAEKQATQVAEKWQRDLYNEEKRMYEPGQPAGWYEGRTVRWTRFLVRNRLPYIKRHRPWQAYGFGDAKPPEHEGGHLSVEELVKMEEAAALWDCINSVLDKAEVQLIMNWMGRVNTSLTHKELAEKLDVEVKTIYNRIKRAKEKLQKCLSSKGIIK